MPSVESRQSRPTNIYFPNPDWTNITVTREDFPSAKEKLKASLLTKLTEQPTIGPC